MSLDIGPATAAKFAAVINNSKTVIWNGPMGVFEYPKFKEGSQALYDAISEGTANRGLVSIVGGGDTAAFVAKQNPTASDISHISTGGGASLELMEGKPLPGVLYLSDRA